MFQLNLPLAVAAYFLLLGENKRKPCFKKESHVTLTLDLKNTKSLGVKPLPSQNSL